MTPEQGRYFDEMEFLFGQPGWKNFIEDIRLRQSQERDNLFTSKLTGGDLSVLMGQNKVYEYILSLEDVLSGVKRELQEIDEQTNTI